LNLLFFSNFRHLISPVKKRIRTLQYLLTDYLTATAAWFLFVNYRVYYISHPEDLSGFFIETNGRYIGALIGIPLLWLAFYALTGYYGEVFRKSRLKEFAQTFAVSLQGNLVIFFGLILDDAVMSYKSYYYLFFGLFGTHFLLTWSFRFVQTHLAKVRISKGVTGFNTLIVGGNTRALQLYQSILANDKTHGYRFIGFLNIQDSEKYELSEYLPHLGSLTDAPQLIKIHQIEEVLIAIESSHYQEVGKIIDLLSFPNLIVKVIPSLYDILTGKVRMSFFLGTPLIIISQPALSEFQANLKRIFDITFSLSALIISLPLTVSVAILLKFGSKGGVFYTQERIGRSEKPFKIFKFRTMIPNAELNGPQLSSANDPRITRIGRILRKYRIDEIPQFINVLKGEMSVVGPRPERRFYIDKIMKHAPHYAQLFRARPGITSWGAVKYGYTENLEQMLEQLNYDIYYVENMSFYLDIKILLYTVGVVLRREGK